MMNFLLWGSILFKKEFIRYINVHSFSDKANNNNNNNNEKKFKIRKECLEVKVYICTYTLFIHKSVFHKMKNTVIRKRNVFVCVFALLLDFCIHHNNLLHMHNQSSSFVFYFHFYCLHTHTHTLCVFRHMYIFLFIMKNIGRLKLLFMVLAAYIS